MPPIIVGTADPKTLYGQPSGNVPGVQGSTPSIQGSNPAPAVIPAPKATQTGIQDFSKDYGLFNGTV